jgi:hypothetical protein
MSCCVKGAASKAAQKGKVESLSSLNWQLATDNWQLTTAH